VTQKVIGDILAVVAPILVVLMTYLTFVYQMKTGDKRSTVAIIIDELQKAALSLRKKAYTAQTAQTATEIPNPTSDIQSTPSVYTSKPDTQNPTPDTQNPKPKTQNPKERQILPREIAAKIDNLGLDLPKVDSFRRYVTRKGTGDNDQKLLNALAQYETELNLTHNFNPHTWDFEGSTQPKFYGIAEEWVEVVGYSKKETKIVNLKKIS
jgi:hypothetical protein